MLKRLRKSVIKRRPALAWRHNFRTVKRDNVLWLLDHRNVVDLQIIEKVELYKQALPDTDGVVAIRFHPTGTSRISLGEGRYYRRAKAGV